VREGGREGDRVRARESARARERGGEYTRLHVCISSVGIVNVSNLLVGRKLLVVSGRQELYLLGVTIK
jgi:hypothetical protein